MAVKAVSLSRRVACLFAATLGLLAVGATDVVAAPAVTKSLAISNGMNRIRLDVPQRTGDRPPLILLGISPRQASCQVASYDYQAVDGVGSFSLSLACRSLPRGARARLTFRPPVEDTFPLRNGMGSISFRLAVPAGRVLPLAELQTAPEDRNCQVVPSHVHDGGGVFTASAQVSCSGLPADARASVSVGGLLAAQPAGASAIAAGPGRVRTRPSSGQSSAVEAAAKCEPVTLTIAGVKLVDSRVCKTEPITLGPWQSRLIGTIPIHCPAGWSKVPVLDPFAAVLVDPSRVPHTLALSLLTNWSFHEDIRIARRYSCIKR